MKNKIMAPLCALTIALWGLCSCQQSEWLEDMVSLPTKDSPAISRSISCTITTEKGGQLDSLLTVKAKEEGIDKKQFTDISVVGPFGKDDAACLRSITALRTIDLTQSRFEPYKWMETFDPETGERTRIEFIGVFDEMFADMRKVTEILLPEGITYIGRYAFGNCSSLTELTIPESVVEFGNYTFYNCTSLKSVAWPSGVHELPHAVFYDCANLQFNIPDHITSIGSYAFSGCASLTEMTIPESVVQIEGEAFYNCTSLKSVTWPSGIHELPYAVFAYCYNLQFSIPDHITSIGGEAFKGCTGLTEAILPNTVEYLGRRAFEDCVNLQKVKLSDKLTDIDAETFHHCFNLKEINLPDGIGTISYHAFDGCASLTSIKLPESLTLIEEFAFRGCTQLKQVEFNSKVEELQTCCFSGCESLLAVTLPESLKEIQEGAFRHTGLSTLTIPASVEECRWGIVESCPNLGSVIWNAKIAIPAITYLDRTIENDDFDYDGYSTLCQPLIFAPEGVGFDSRNLNVINGDRAAKIMLSQDYAMNAPRSFTAETVIYTKHIPWYETIPGQSCGWMSISLPFNVTSIAQKIPTGERAIAPFNAGVEGAYPFWLRELTTDGYKNVTQIEANKPYIMAMPNSESFLPEYHITGDVVFYGQNVTFEATTNLSPAVGSDYSLWPNYATIAPSNQIWALNEEECFSPVDGRKRKPGSIFVAGQRTVRPYECYVTSTASSRTVWSIGTSTAATRSTRAVGSVPTIEDM